MSSSRKWAVLASIATLVAAVGLSLPWPASPPDVVPLELGWPFTETERGSSGWHMDGGSDFHRGPDCNAQDWNFGKGSDDSGMDVLSATTGTVVRSTDSGGCYGEEVVVRSLIAGRRIYVRYAHLENRTALVGPIFRSEKLGEVGSSGAGRGCGDWPAHLHMAVYAYFPPITEADGIPFVLSEV